MSEIKILSVKLLKGAESLQVQFKKQGPAAGSDGFKGDNRPHPDLVTKFQALGLHLAVLGDYIKAKDAKKASLEKFVVTSYHYTIKEESIKVKVIGYKLTEFGASFINPPNISLDEDDNDYPLYKDLADKLADIDEEAILYLGGKKAPDPQQSLFPDEDDDTVTHMQIAQPEDQDDEEQDDDSDEEFLGEETMTSKKARGGLPHADKEAMGRVKEWSPGEYLNEIGKGEQIDAEKEKAETKKRGRKIKNK